MTYEVVLLKKYIKQIDIQFYINFKELLRIN